MVWRFTFLIRGRKIQPRCTGFRGALAGIVPVLDCLSWSRPLAGLALRARRCGLKFGAQTRLGRMDQDG
ncbi:MAG: hypothetical protein DWH96_08625, partial [Planctomycetota bacterium]